jgi:hypothetical protein
VTRQTESDEQGSFIVRDIDPVEYQLRAEEQTFVSVTLDISVSRGQQKQVTLQFRQPVSVSQAVTVVATAPSLLTPDPAQSIVIHDPLLDANPGRPGAPISIPGLARETASGGTKAPQYVAPGVAGDHGEPIAQYFQIGIFSIQTTCPPIPTGTAMPIRISSFLRRLKPSRWTGNFSMFDKETTLSTLLSSCVSRQRFRSFVQITGEYRDADVMAGWSASNPQDECMACYGGVVR